MSYEENKDEEQRVVWGVLIALGTVLIGGIIAFAASVGSGDSGATKSAANGAAAVAATPAAAVAPAAPAAADGSKVVVENGVVKFYFGSGKADLAQGSDAALADVVKGLKAGQKAVISGYHDSTGNLASNQELAKKRAISVRDALVHLGAPVDHVEMKKPENSSGTGPASEARRVEVVLAK